MVTWPCPGQRCPLCGVSDLVMTVTDGEQEAGGTKAGGGLPRKGVSKEGRKLVFR